MKRRVGLLFINDTTMLTNIDVHVTHDHSVRRFFDYLGTVEYTDGSFLDVYYGGALIGYIGFEYDAEGNPM